MKQVGAARSAQLQQQSLVLHADYEPSLSSCNKFACEIVTVGQEFRVQLKPKTQETLNDRIKTPCYTHL